MHYSTPSNYAKYLEEIKKDNEYLYELYLKKEILLSVFDNAELDKDKAEKQISEWIDDINNSSYECLKMFVKTLKRRMPDILN